MGGGQKETRSQEGKQEATKETEGVSQGIQVRGLSQEKDDDDGLQESA